MIIFTRMTRGQSFCAFLLFPTAPSTRKSPLTSLLSPHRQPPLAKPFFPITSTKWGEGASSLWLTGHPARMLIPKRPSGARDLSSYLSRMPVLSQRSESRDSLGIQARMRAPKSFAHRCPGPAFFCIFCTSPAGRLFVFRALRTSYRKCRGRGLGPSGSIGGRWLTVPGSFWLEKWPGSCQVPHMALQPPIKCSC